MISHISHTNNKIPPQRIGVAVRDLVILGGGGRGEENLQCSHSQNHHHRRLDPPLHLNRPNQNRRQNRQRQIRHNRHSRKKETDGAVEPRIAHARAGPPQRIDGVADVTNGDNKDDGRAKLQRDEPPQRPGESAAPVGDADQTDTDAALDGDSAGCVKEFGNVKELF